MYTKYTRNGVMVLPQVMQKMPNMVPGQTVSSESNSAVCENRNHLEYQQRSTGDHMGGELFQAGKYGSAEGRVSPSGTASSAIAGSIPQSESERHAFLSAD